MDNVESSLFEKLPNEILFHIIQFLSYNDVLTLSQCNKSLCNFIYDDDVWKYLLRRDMPILANIKSFEQNNQNLFSNIAHLTDDNSLNIILNEISLISVGRKYMNIYRNQIVNLFTAYNLYYDNIDKIAKNNNNDNNDTGSIGSTNGFTGFTSSTGSTNSLPHAILKNITYLSSLMHNNLSYDLMLRFASLRKYRKLYKNMKYIYEHKIISMMPMLTLTRIAPEDIINDFVSPFEIFIMLINYKSLAYFPLLDNILYLSNFCEYDLLLKIFSLVYVIDSKIISYHLGKEFLFFPGSVDIFPRSYKESQYIDVYFWLIYHGLPLNNNIMYASIYFDSVELLEYIHTNSSKCADDSSKCINNYLDYMLYKHPSTYVDETYCDNVATEISLATAYLVFAHSVITWFINNIKTYPKFLIILRKTIDIYYYYYYNGSITQEQYNKYKIILDTYSEYINNTVVYVLQV
jgi:hypothetical protein